MDEEAPVAEAVGRLALVKSAGMRAGQWMVYFVAAFVLTAGILLLAHI